MMTYHQQNRKNNKKRTLFFVVVVILALIIIDYVSTGKVRGGVRIAIEPLIHVYDITSKKTSNVLGNMYAKSSLIEENEKLTEKLTELNAVQEVNTILMSEVDTLRNIAVGVLKKDSIVARVLSTKGISIYGTILIENPIETAVVGDVVRTRAGAALGIIDTLNAKTATVLLFSAPNTETDVRIGSNAVVSSVRGVGGKNMTIKLPRDADVSLGDMVTVREFGGYLIGVVGDIVMNDSDAFKVVRVLLAVDPTNMQFVIIEHVKK